MTDLRFSMPVAGALRWAMLGLAAAIAVAAIGSDPADARVRRPRAPASVKAYNPPYAAIVIDANSAKVLHSDNADSVRHPASLTKIMTLYLLFEQLDAGKLKLDSSLPVSAHAAAQAPTKLGLAPGETITVEDAIKGTVTKSANDAAAVIAEAVAGSEAEFARLMTQKARALGMSRTVYVNASGLPDDRQVSSAGDQALLGRAIQERFPAYYRYFATTSFEYRGIANRNHNRLLGQVDGVDGIKTGYVRASGFNIVTSVRRDNRHIVAVVLGGPSSKERDARMRALIDATINQASTQRTAPAISDPSDLVAARTAPIRTAASAAPAPQPGPPSPVPTASDGGGKGTQLLTSLGGDQPGNVTVAGIVAMSGGGMAAAGALWLIIARRRGSGSDPLTRRAPARSRGRAAAHAS